MVQRDEDTTSETPFLTRRLLLKTTAVACAGAALGNDAQAEPSPTPLLKPRFEKIVCPWTPENPRHDHQLIFPLKDGGLLLVWCEYYVNRPSLIDRDRTNRKGQAGDDMPCRISARVC